MILIFKDGKQSVKSTNMRQYTGEKIPGDLSQWSYFGTNPNDILKVSYEILSQRSTTLYHTYPPVAAAVNKMSHYAIGPGLVFRSQPDWRTLGMNEIDAKEWSMEFQKAIHYIFLLLNYYEKQSTLFKTSLITGDSLLLFDRKFSDIEGIPFDLIDLSGDNIDFQGYTKYKRKDTTLGIVHDEYFRKQGVILTNGNEISFKDKNGDQNLLHVFFKNMSRQLRGFPLAYRIIAAAKNNDRLMDATLARMVMETVILGNSRSETEADNINQQTDNLVNIAKNGYNSTAITTTDYTSNLNAKNILPGSVYEYSGKGGIEYTELKTPSNNFDKMQNTFIDFAGMALDMPPEVILSKYNTSYTAHKGAFNDFIKSFMFYRHRFINNVNKIVVKECAKYLIYNEIIRSPHPRFFDNAFVQEAALSGMWLGPVPGHINPLQEVNAKKTAVEEKFNLRSNVALEYGNEFENFSQEWEQEELKFQAVSNNVKGNIMQTDLQQFDENGNLITDQ